MERRGSAVCDRRPEPPPAQALRPARRSAPDRRRRCRSAVLTQCVSMMRGRALRRRPTVRPSRPRVYQRTPGAKAPTSPRRTALVVPLLARQYYLGRYHDFGSWVKRNLRFTAKKHLRPLVVQEKRSPRGSPGGVAHRCHDDASSVRSAARGTSTAPGDVNRIGAAGRTPAAASRKLWRHYARCDTRHEGVQGNANGGFRDTVGAARSVAMSSAGKVKRRD